MSRGYYGVDRSDVRRGRAWIGAATNIDIAAKTASDMFRAQRKAFSDKRGFDKVMPPAMPHGLGFGAYETDIPRTTNGDVLQLAKYWTSEMGKLTPGHYPPSTIDPIQLTSYWTSALANVRQLPQSYDTHVAQWRIVLDDLDRIAKPGKPDDVYPKNNEFWRTAYELSMLIDTTNSAPTKLTMAIESAEYGIKHLPETLKNVAEKVGEDAWKIIKYGAIGVLALGTVVVVSNLRRKS